MQNRIAWLPEEAKTRESEGPKPMGEILAELLAKYEARFPDIRVTVVETSVGAHY